MKFRLTRPRRPIDRPDTVRPTAVVWIDSPEYDEDGPLRIESEDEFLAERVRDALLQSYGNRARPLDGEFSPRDLAVAMGGRIMQPFEPAEVPGTRPA